MAAAPDRVSNFLDPAGYAGRGLVVHDHHCLDGVRPIIRQACFNVGRINAMSPVSSDKLDSELQPFGHGAP